jgi:UPF0755 protein
MDNKDNLYKNNTFVLFFQKWLKTIILILICLIIFFYYLLRAPVGNKDVYYHVYSGQTVKEISLDLKEKNAIRNTFILTSLIRIFKSDKGIVPGDYLIKNNSSVWHVARQLVKGNHNVNKIKITFREGINNDRIAELLSLNLAGFRRDLFISMVNDRQGYLFPDTYFFFPYDTTEEIVYKFVNNFKNKTNKIFEDKKEKEISDIIKMASILEGEAKGKEDIYIISGILWKRLSKNMLLQVDVDRNTYIENGLPNRPLNNPGLLSIDAALNPKDSIYLYYLHDKQGNIYYGRNYNEHQQNINKYLKK